MLSRVAQKYVVVFMKRSTKAEHMIQPDSMADDLGGEPMAVVRVRWWLHALTVVRFPPGCQTLLP